MGKHHGQLGAIAALAAFLLFPAAVGAVTTSGSLTADETWSGTVSLTGDLTVPNGITLSIQPGTTVLFPAAADDMHAGADTTRTELIVQGSLNAAGTAALPISLKSGAAVPAAGNWGGVRVNWGVGSQTLLMEYCVIEHATSAVVWQATAGFKSGAVRHNTIRTLTLDAISVVANNGAKLTVDITGNDITGTVSATRGVACDVRGTGTEIGGAIDGNTIVTKTAHGIHLYTTSPGNSAYGLTVRNNLVHHNGSSNSNRHGIYVYGYNSNSSSPSSVSVVGNTVYGYHHGIAVVGLQFRLNAAVLDNTVFNCTYNGVHLSSSDQYAQYPMAFTVSGNDLHHNGGRGLAAFTEYSSSVNASVVVNNNTVHENSSNGIYLTSATSGRTAEATITLNEVYGNQGSGVYVGGPFRVLMLYNDIRDNAGDALHLAAGTLARVNYHEFTGNAGAYDLRYEGSSLVDARANYWGPLTTAAMDAGPNPQDLERIYDQSEDEAVGRVDYAGWLGGGFARPSQPLSHLTAPAAGSTLRAQTVRISGTAVAPARLARVEVSTDNGATWATAQGTASWYYDWSPPHDGSYSLLSRAVDLSEQFEVPAAGVAVAVDSALPQITSGQLAQSETWSGDIWLAGDLVVPAGVTLTLAPGTTLRFAAGQDDQGMGGDSRLGELIVRGNLVASGTEGNPILLTSSSASPGRGDWQGVRVEANTSGQTVDLTHCTIEHAVTGVGVFATTSGLAVTPAVTLDHCAVHGAMTDGVFASAEGAAKLSVTVRDSQIEGAGRYGVYGYSRLSNSELSLNVTGSTLAQDHVAGVKIYGDTSGTGPARLTVVGGAITACGNGIDFGSTNGSLALEARGTNIAQCTNGIFSASASTSYSYPFTVSIRDCDLHANSACGLSLTRSGSGTTGATVELVNNRVQDNGTDGVYLSLPDASLNPDPVFSLNTVTGNGRGAYVQAPGADVIANQISGAAGDGLVVAALRGATVQRNNISDNGTGGFELRNEQTAPIDARWNYWGTLATQEMEDGGNPKNVGRIRDRFDDAAKGGVDYAPWLSTAGVLPTAPVSWIGAPADGAAMKTSLLRIQGVAAAPAGVSLVEVSTDNGGSWHAATGTYTWTYDWASPANGTHTVLTRARDGLGVYETVGIGIQVTIDDTLPTTTGTLTTSETWTGTVAVTGDLTVAAGATLTLAPGTVVRFPALRDDQAGGTSAARTELIVKGSLVAQGTAASPIRFTSDSTSPGKGDWEGIRVDATAGAASLTLEHAVVEYAVNGISATAGAHALNVSLSGVTVQHHAADGVAVAANSGSIATVTVDGSTITDCSGRGLYAFASYPASPLAFAVSNSTISANGSYGIHLYGQWGLITADIFGNIISGNAGSSTFLGGIYAYFGNQGGGGTKSTLTVRGNQILSNGTYGINTYLSGVDLDRTIVGNLVDGHTYGIYCQDQWTPSQGLVSVVRGNELRNSTSYGILISQSNVTYAANEFTANNVHHGAAVGVYFQSSLPVNSGAPDVLFALNDVHDNAGTGISYSALLPARFLLNNVHGNGGDGVFLQPAGAGSRAAFNGFWGSGGSYEFNNQSVNGVDAARNYWGEAARAQMESGGNPKDIERIRDYYNSASYGRVDYADWLAAPEVLPTVPHSRIFWPATASVHKLGTLHVQGIAVAPAGVALVEVSADGGETWFPAQGTDFWSYDWAAPGDGSYTLLTRVTDSAGLMELPGSGIAVSIDHTLPTTSGLLTADETWSGVVTLTGDVTVPPGVTLTIAPGTTVIFPSQRDDQAGGANPARAELIVQGTLDAAGAAGSTILFTSSSPTPTSGDWYGIRLAPTTAAATVNLTQCTVEYATVGVSATAAATATDSELSINGCTLRNTSGDGVYALAPAGTRLGLSVRGSTITSANGNGIHCSALSGGLKATLADNTVSYAGNGISCHGYGFSTDDRPFTVAIMRNQLHHNRTAGIDCTSESVVGLSAEVTGNAVYANAVNGVKLWSSASTQNRLHAVVTLNEVYGNTGYGIYCQSGAGSETAIVYNDVHGNSGAGLQLERSAATTAWFNNLDGDAGGQALTNQTSSPVNARMNYWGAAPTAIMAAGGNPKDIGEITDVYDTGTLGRVDYAEWLSAAVTRPAALFSRIVAPASGAYKSRHARIEGVAVSPNGVAYVEVSTDGGASWAPAQGREQWYHDWTAPEDGIYAIRSRVIDRADLIETPGAGITLTFDGALPTTSGTLVADETWTGVVAISGDVTVPEGRTLTVEPGTVIRFASLADDQAGGAATTLAELVVSGSLIARGTAANPIVFGSTSTGLARGDWQGIRFQPATSGSALTLEYVTVENAVTGVNVDADGDTAAVSLSHCILRNFTEDGLYLWARNSARVTLAVSESEVANALKKGLHCYAENSLTEVTATVTASLVHDTGETAIYLHNSSSTAGGRTRYTVRGTEVRACGNGIYAHAEYGDIVFDAVGNSVTGCSEGISAYAVDGNTGSSPRIQITDNTVSGNAGNGIRCDAKLTGSLASLAAEITGNRSLGNGGDGISCRTLNTTANALSGVVAFNSVSGNWGAGIRLKVPTVARVLFNNVEDNDDAALINESASAVDARHNWWGATTTAAMAAAATLGNMAGITDYFDNSAIGIVNYTEWSGAELTGLTGPLSRMFTPGRATTRGEGTILVEGVAQAPAGIDRVQVSLDNGQTWADAVPDTRFAGKSLWSLSAPDIFAGSYTLLSRVIAADGGQETPGAGTDLLVQAGRPTVSGTLSASETWSGTVALEGDVTVPAGATLTILPGTTVIAPSLVDATFGGSDAARTEIVGLGNIFAEGAEGAPIEFTTSTGRQGDWYGLRVFGSTRLRYATVEDGRTGVTFAADAGTDELVVQQTTVRNNAVDGIAASGSGTADTVFSISGSTVSGNGGNGIAVTTQGTGPLRPVISGNLIANNGQAGFSYTGTASVVQTVPLAISGNTIRDNVSQGISIAANSSMKAQIAIENNTVLRSGTNIEITSNTTQSSTLRLVGNTASDGIRGVKVTVSTGFNTIGALSFSNNTVQDNTLEGIWCSATSTADAVRLEGNTVTGNASRGVYLAASGSATLAANNLHDNTGYDLYNDAAGAVNARGNWWGTTTTPEMIAAGTSANIAAIYDYRDNSAKGLVDYADWLNTLETPPDPTLDPVVSPTGASSQLLTGSKGAGSAIVINGVEQVPAGPETSWSYSLALTEGNNAVALQARTPAGMTSRTVTAAIVRDTVPPYLYIAVPANGSAQRRVVEAIDLTLVDAATAVDPAASLTGAGVLDGGSAAVPGTWSTSYNHLIFTPQAPLGAGTYTVTVNPADTPLGNSGMATVVFSVDLSAPGSPGLNAVSPITRATSQTISGTKDSGTSIWLDNAQVVALDAATTWSYPLTLVEGANAHVLFARDAAGNRSPDVPFAIIKDTVAPTLAGTTPASGTVSNVRPAQVVLTFTDQSTSIDATATLSTAALRDGASQTVAGAWSVPATNIVSFTPTGQFAEGAYSAVMTATDLAGNTLAVNQSVFTYDATPPQAPTVSPVTSPTNNANQTLAGTKGANSGIWINGAAAVAANDASTTWSYLYHLAAGTNTLSITSRDVAGNQSGAVTVTIVYDDVAPLPVSNLTANGSGTGTTVALNWTGYDEQGQGDVDYYKIFVLDHLFTQVSGVPPTATVDAGTFTYTATGLTRGASYWCAVVAVDIHNNERISVTPISTVTQDGVPPENATNLRAQSLDQRLVFAWNASDDTQGDLDKYKVYFGADSPVTLPKTQLSFDRSGLAEGTAYTCRVTSVDGTGNESTGVSLTAPTVLPNPGDVTVQPWSGYATVSWSSAGLAQYRKHYAVYAGPTPFTSVEFMSPRITTTSTTANVGGLTNNTPYYFAVTTVNTLDGERDQVTTVEATPVPDTVGPEITAFTADGIALADGALLTRPATLSVSATDGSGVARVEFLLDGAVRSVDWSGSPAYTYLWDVTATSDGPHTLGAVAYDTLGRSTTVTHPITVALAPPAAPTITSPVSGVSTNNPTLAVSGTADRFATVAVSVNGQPAFSVATGTGTSFSGNVTLADGANAIVATGENRAGIGPASATLAATLDRTLPAAPGGLSAQALAGGAIRLAWSRPVEIQPRSFFVYRASQSFSTPAAATKVATVAAASTSWDDHPQPEGRYFYRVSLEDMAGNESDLSDEVSASADGTAPAALSLAYAPQGPYDAASGRFGRGAIDVTLRASERLQAVPFLSFTPAGGAPLPIVLTATDDLTYTGRLTVGATTPSGTAQAVFSGRDFTGNAGHDILAGGTILLDTRGPGVSSIAVQPPAPIHNDPAAPAAVLVTFVLDEAPAQAPDITCLLSGVGRQPAALASITNVSGTTWTGTCQLPADAGQAAPETLSFALAAVDDLGNSGGAVQGANAFQIYQGGLPPLPVPQGVAAVSQAAGAIRITWQPVAGAADYQLYRQAPGEQALSAFQRTAAATVWVDTPAAEGTYAYAVASVRIANDEESLSAQSATVQADSDATVPGAPTALTLTLSGTGVDATWQPPVANESITYSLYRAASPIAATAGLTPVKTHLADTHVLDAQPSPTDHYYAVTAVDASGNESAPSENAYLNAQLLPVATLNVVQSGADHPVVSWTHAATGLAGYNVYLRDPLGGAADVKLNAQPIPGLSYTDTGWTGSMRLYAITAVDGQGYESVKRSIALPTVTAARAAGATIQRGLFNRLEYALSNAGTTQVEHARLRVALGGQSYATPEVTLAPGASQAVSLLVGGARELPTAATLTATVEIVPNAGEKVEIVRDEAVTLGDGVLALDLTNEAFVRGASGNVRFELRNTGPEEIEILLAKAGGAGPSNEISASLLDADGNVLSSRQLQQTTGDKVVAVGGGDIVARIPAGETFVSDPIAVTIPAASPDTVRARIEISHIHYHLGLADHASMDGVGTSREIVLDETPYFGEVTAVAPLVSNGDSPIQIAGRAVDRASGQPLPETPLNLVVWVGGFYRTFPVTTGVDGTFSYSFTPNAGESGLYSVAAVHPALVDRPMQAQFTINRLGVTPASITMPVPRNYESQLTVNLSAGPTTAATNVRLVYEASYQPGGVLPSGVHVVPGAAVASVAPNRSAALTAAVWVDNDAPAQGSFKIAVVSDETPAGSWGLVSVSYQVTSALPSLAAQPSFLETGVALGGTVTETLALKNMGSVPVEGVAVALVNLDGTPAPSWVQLLTAAQVGTIAPGAEQGISIGFSPPADATEGIHSFLLRVSGTGYEGSDVPIYVTVTQSGVGGVIFKISDIYTGTLDAGGAVIQGVSGARVTLQNELVPSLEQTLTTDAYGEAYFAAVPAGAYRVRITASSHDEYLGRAIVRPAVTTAESVFINYQLVTITWDLVETTVPDVYRYVMNVTYKTDVPAAVLVARPASYPAPAGNVGDYYLGDFVVTNHGLVTAKDVALLLAQDVGYLHESLGSIPDTLAPGQSFTLTLRVTKTSAESNDDSSDGCEKIVYYYDCFSGKTSEGKVDICREPNPTGTTQPREPRDDPKPSPITGARCLPTGSGGGGAGDGTGGGNGSGDPPPPGPQGPDQPQNPATSKCATTQPTSSCVDLLKGTYSDDEVDLVVAVPGGEVRVAREYKNRGWRWNHTRRLDITRDDDDGHIVKIVKDDYEFLPAQAGSNVFSRGTETITAYAPDPDHPSQDWFFWQDRRGEFIKYNYNGRILYYGNRGRKLAELVLEAGRVMGVLAFDGVTQASRQVLWYEYYEDGRLREVRTTAGTTDEGVRRVRYFYEDYGGQLLLQAVRSYPGNSELEFSDRTYTYRPEAPHPLASKTDERGTITIDYETATGYVKSVLDRNGEGHSFAYEVLAEESDEHFQICSDEHVSLDGCQRQDPWLYCPRRSYSGHTDLPTAYMCYYVVPQYTDVHDKQIHVTVTNVPEGFRKQIWYHEGGEAKKIVMGNQVVEEITTFSFKDGLRQEVRDDKGAVTKYLYDRNSSGAMNDVTSVSYPDGSRDDYTYTDLGQIQSITRRRPVEGGWADFSKAVYHYAGYDVAKEAEGCDGVDASGEGTNCLRVREYAGYTLFGQPDTVTVSGEVAAAAITSYTFHADNGRVHEVAEPRLTLDTPLVTAVKYEDYDAAGNAQKRTVRGQGVWSYIYDNQGRLLEVDDPLHLSVDPMVKYVYNNVGDIISTTRIKDGAPVVFHSLVDYSSESAFKIQRERDPDDDRKLLAVWTTRDGRVTRLVDHDVADEVEVVSQKVFTYYADRRLQSTYDVDGDQETTEEANKVEYRYYDHENVPAGEKGYFDIWRIAYPTYAREFTYDGMHRVVTETRGTENQDGTLTPISTRQFRYGYTTNRTFVTEIEEFLVEGAETWVVQHRAVRRLYDRLGRLAEIEYYGTLPADLELPAAPAATEVFRYDCRDNLVAVIDRKGNATAEPDDDYKYVYQRDLKGRVVKVFRPGDIDGPFQEITYDYNDEVHKSYQTIKDKKQQSIVRTFDARGRLEREELIPLPPGQTQTIDYVYNELDALVDVRVKQGDGAFSSQVSFTRDKYGRALTETSAEAGKSIAYTYYRDGRLQSLAAPVPGSDEPTGYWYGYDPYKRLANIGIRAHGATAFPSVGFGDYVWYAPQSVVLPEGFTKSYTYDDLMRPTRISGRVSSLPNDTLNLGYSKYDRNDNLLRRTDGGVLDYRYNHFGQLISVASQEPPIETFHYDLNGNRKFCETPPCVTQDVSPSCPSPPCSTWQVNENNELTIYDTSKYVYDANGNVEERVTSSLKQRYQYDVLNRLVRVANIDRSTGDEIPPVTTYGYDAFSRRTWKQTGTVKTSYLYSSQGLAAEISEGAVTKAYAWVPESPWGTNPLLQMGSGGIAWYLNDHLGTPRKAVRDKTWDVVWAGEAKAFGETQVTNEGIVSNLRFPGQYYDKETEGIDAETGLPVPGTGLHYNWNRYYDPSLGRYL
ncbi:MAG TPA: right-handed parallel beta-helix repeat-containing protein, partial [bacterium]